MSDVLEFFRTREPRFKDVPDDELTGFIGKRYPEFLQDAQFKTRFDDVGFEAPVTPEEESKLIQPLPELIKKAAAVGEFGADAVSFGGDVLRSTGENIKHPLSIPQRFFEAATGSERLPGVEETLLKPLAPIAQPVSDLIQQVAHGRGAEGVANLIQYGNAGVRPEEAESTFGKIVGGVGDFTGGLAEFFTSPAFLLSAGAGAMSKTAQKAVAGIWAQQMTTSMPEVAKELGQEWSKPPGERDLRKMTSTALAAISTPAFAATAAAHALKPAPRPTVIEQKAPLEATSAVPPVETANVVQQGVQAGLPRAAATVARVAVTPPKVEPVVEPTIKAEEIDSTLIVPPEIKAPDVVPVTETGVPVATDLFPDLKGKAPTLERVRRSIEEAEADLAVKNQAFEDAGVTASDPLYDIAVLAEKRVDRLRKLGATLEQAKVEELKAGNVQEPKPPTPATPAASPVTVPDVKGEMKAVELMTGDAPRLVTAIRNGNTIRIEVDASGPAVTADQIKRMFESPDRSVEVIAFEPNEFSTAQGRANFSVIVGTPEGPYSTPLAKKAFKEAFGTDEPIAGTSAVEQAMPFEKRFTRSIQAAQAREVGNAAPPSPPVVEPRTSPPVAETVAQPAAAKVAVEPKKWIAVSTSSHRQVQRLDRFSSATGGLPVGLGSKTRVWKVEDTPENRAIAKQLGLPIRAKETSRYNEMESRLSDEPKPAATEGEMRQTSRKTDAFERARRGEETAFDDLDSQFRNTYPEPEELWRSGRPNPNQVHTPQAFTKLFNDSFKARDFDSILNAVKATSDVSIWKPFLKDLFAKQAADPIAAKKAEWFRHIFNGTIPPDAVPPKAPKAKASTGPAPAQPTSPPPPQPPPAPASTRIPVKPIAGGGAKSPFKIIEDFSTAIGKSIRVLRMKKGGLGVYRPGSTLTAERFAGDLDTAAHELAGHWTDDKHGIGKQWVNPRTRSPYDNELAKFWIHGSVTPKSTLRYRRAEGIAEFIRAYAVNPNAAKAEAPKFHAYFEKTLPPEALKAINDFGADIRTWAGEDPLIRAGLNIRMNPPTLRERLWKGFQGRGFGFEINPIDKVRLWFDDTYHYAVKADKLVQELRGGTRLPEQNFELLARLLSTHDSRMGNQFENGLVPLRPGQKTNAKGQMDVERLTDPVTKEPMSMEWLLGSLDRTSMEKMQQDMRDSSAFMVAQRTVEKGAQLGRDENVSGIGAGIMSDKQAATELLRRVDADPALKARLEESARRYRLWADQNINMLVDSGRLSKQAAKEIRDGNQFYVDMHRLSLEFDAVNQIQRGVKIGTTRDVIKKFKGSSLELDNVYKNLLEQTDSIQKEAHRNVVMNTFVDGLRNVRELHGPNLKDFDQFGRKVTSKDRNTITIYKDGKPEHWQFEPDIYESLKGLGELGTHAFIDIAALPSTFARYMITHGPQFIARNIARDTMERTVQSRSGSKPWDILQGYSDATLSRYEVFGGGQFGNYIVDRHVWNRELKTVMRDLSKDPTTILLSPLKLKTAWEQLSAKSEKLGRTAEFKRAFDRGKKELGYDDYNAALFAAGESRGLLDFAKAGTVMRVINRLIPFSNAAMRGLGRTYTGAKENPGRYAMRWGLAVLAPTLGVMLWNKRDPETWEEYMQLPAYRRDFFWNLKVGSYWLTIPKPHLLGVLAGGVERAVIRTMGDKRAMEGYGGSLASNLPIRDPVEGTGPLKTLLELEFNRDSFRDRDIVPAWEKDLSLDLRKGTEHASGAGKGIAAAINMTGLQIDPRQVDHVLNSYGGVGQLVTGSTRSTQPIAQTALKATGFVTTSPGTDARDVQWVIDWAKKTGNLNASYIRDLSALRKAVFETKDADERAAALKELRSYATQLRNEIEEQR